MNASAYTDLRFTVALNTTPGNPTHYLDRFILGPDPGSSHCTPVDDSNPCTADDCDPATGQTTHLPLAPGAFCNDDVTCNGTETCDGAGTCNSNALDLDDENPCTIDACDEVNGVTHVPAAAGTSCADDTLCNGVETCDGAGACQAGTAPALDDNNPCTTDSCDSQAGVTHEPVSSGTSCGDEDVCNGLEVCDGSGACQSGSAPTLDDNNPCTADACDPEAGVTHTPLSAGTSCDNGNLCDGVDACDGAGACASGAPPIVDDGNACTADSCDPALGVIHVNVSAGASCDNGDVCDGADACDGAGSCQAGAPPSVDDNNPCTADACDAVLGVTHTPLSAGASCGDGDACNGAETCDGAGSCQAGTPVETDDGNACTIGSCDPETGAVSQVPVPVDAPCGDGNACNGAEFCDGAGACQAGSSPNIDDENPCTADSCDPLFGVEHAAEAAGTSCLDADLCDGSEACDGFGACVEGTPLDLDDENPCTEDLCDPSAGPSHPAAPAGTNCSDENVCNGAELCDGSGSCGAGEPLDPDDGNVCTVDVCDPLLGAQHTPSPAGTSCDDGNICTGSNTCDGAGACQSPGHPDFDDGDPCTVDSCDPVTGVSHEPAGEGSICSDGNACNGLEVCDVNGSCNPGTPPLEDDNNPCTADSCDPVAGVLNEPLDAGTSCDLGMCMGTGECTVDALCERTVAGLIPDADPCTLEFCDEETGALEVVTCSENNLAALTPTGVTMAYLHAPGGPQKDVESGAFNPETSGAIRGRVLWQDGLGVPNVRVEVLGEPKYGHTRTQIDGNFVLAVPGGREVMLVLTKDGYPSIRRAGEVPLRSVDVLDDVVLVQRDHKASRVTMGLGVGQVASATPQTDEDGTRTARLYVPPGTQSWLKMPDGSTVNMPELTVRATEYTVGERGPERMPAALPPASAYTYALEVTADEAVAAGTDVIEFDRNVYLYTDNFLGFEAGLPIPQGIVDYDTGKWTGEAHGVVIEVVSEEGGIAQVSGVADYLLPEHGLGQEELRIISQLYEPGDTFWRMPRTHLSQVDFNGLWLLANSEPPDFEVSADSDRRKDSSGQCRQGSRIDPNRLSVIHDVSLVGSDAQLHANSTGAEGLFSDVLTVTYGGGGTTEDLLGLRLSLVVGGRRIEKEIRPVPAPGSEHTIGWDGLDEFGRPVQGVLPAELRVGHIYKSRYNLGTQFGVAVNSSGGGGGGGGGGVSSSAPISIPTDIYGRQIAIFDRTWRGTMGGVTSIGRGLGGMTLTSHHFLDRGDGSVHFGDGSVTSGTGRVKIATRVIGGGQRTPIFPLTEGENAEDFRFFNFQNPLANLSMMMDVGGDDKIYTIVNANGGSHLLVTDGLGVILRTVALPFEAVAPAVSPDGAIYLAGMWDSVWRVEEDDSITRMARGLLRIQDMEVAPDGRGIYVLHRATSQNQPTSIEYVATAGIPCAQMMDPDACFQSRRFTVLGGLSSGTPLVENRCPHQDDAPGTRYFINDLEFGEGDELLFTSGRISPSVVQAVCRLDGTGGLSSIAYTIAGSGLLTAGITSYVGGIANNQTNFGSQPSSIFEVTPSGAASYFAIKPNAGGGLSINPTPPNELDLDRLLDVEATRDGEVVYVANGHGSLPAIWRIGSSLPRYGGAAAYPSKDRGEVYYFHSDGRHRETRNVFTGGLIRSFEYDANKLLERVTEFDSGGVASQWIGVDRNGDGDPLALNVDVDGDGPASELRHVLILNEEGRVTSVTNPAGERWEMARDEPLSIDLITSFTSPAGYTSSYSYNSEGGLLFQTDPTLGDGTLGGATSYVRRSPVSGELTETEVTTASGLPTTYGYEWQLNGAWESAEVFPDGSKSSTLVDAFGARTRNFRDGTRISSVSRPDPSTYHVHSYDGETVLRLPLSNRAVVLTRSKSASTFQGVVENQTETLCVQTSAGNECAVSSYDADTREVQYTTAAGRTAEIRVDELMTPIERRAAGEPLMKFEYEGNRLVAIVADPDETPTSGEERTTQFEYDSTLGVLAGIVDAESKRTEFDDFDGANRPHTIRSPDGSEIQMTYDAEGNISNVSPPGAGTHVMEFGPKGRLSRYSAPLGNAVSFEYDTDRRLDFVDFGEDLEGNEAQLDFVYSEASGKLQAVDSPDGSTLFGYDSATGQLVSISTPSMGGNIGECQDSCRVSHHAA